MDRRRFLELTGTATAALLAACGGGGGGGTSPTPPVVTGPDWNALATGLNGSLLRPGDTDYLPSSLLINTHWDAIKPAAIVKCASTADVKAALDFVRRNSLSVTPRCGGHSWAGTSTTTGVVLNVTPMNAIQVNADGTAKVGAGARLAEVYDALISKGVCIPSGTCLTVGVSGITMGGGIGVLDRKFGLTCDNLLAAEVVTADGRVLVCDETHEPDLFWAIRGGGGGNFGVATSFTFRTHAIQDITTTRATFRFTDFAGVFKAWQRWQAVLPDHVWGQIYLAFEPNAETFFSVSGYGLGPASAMQPYWDAFLMEVGSAALSPTLSQRGYRDVAWDMCASLSLNQCRIQGQTPEAQKGRYDQVLSSDFFNAQIPDAGIAMLIDLINTAKAAGNSGSYIFDPMGGQLARVAPDATAFVHRNALFSLEYATWPNGRTYDTTLPNRMRTGMAPWSSGGAYVNYLDPLITNPGAAYYGGNYARLQAVKKAYDPARVFNMAQGVVPAA